MVFSQFGTYSAQVAALLSVVGGQAATIILAPMNARAVPNLGAFPA
jgi:hypothetical protein